MLLLLLQLLFLLRLLLRRRVMILLSSEVPRPAATAFPAEAPAAKVSARLLLRWASCWAAQRNFQEHPMSMKHQSTSCAESKRAQAGWIPSRAKQYCNGSLRGLIGRNHGNPQRMHGFKSQPFHARHRPLCPGSTTKTMHKGRVQTHFHTCLYRDLAHVVQIPCPRMPRLKWCENKIQERCVEPFVIESNNFLS